MSFIKSIIRNISPFFIITSPVTSYADQIYSMHRNRSSAGFSLDVPLIMLIASITKVFYWIGARYDFSLFIQASLMVAVQIACLHVALVNRPQPSSDIDMSKPFQPAVKKRPYNFWQWRSIRPYWTFLAYYTSTLAALQVLLGSYAFYTAAIGYVALAVEAGLPLPQIRANHRNRSCKGFRLSVLANWLVGDIMKMSYFFLSGSSVTLPFKLCGMIQFACDLYLGVQYLQFGEGVAGAPNGWTKH